MYARTEHEAFHSTTIYCPILSTPSYSSLTVPESSNRLYCILGYSSRPGLPLALALALARAHGVCA